MNEIKCNHCGSLKLKVYRKRTLKDNSVSRHTKCSVCREETTFNTKDYDSEELDLFFPDTKGSAKFEFTDTTPYYNLPENIKVSEKDITSRVVNDDYERYVITAYQSNTELNLPFFETLENYCEVNNARLCIIPHKYKNPSSYSKVVHKYDPRIEPYRLDENIKIHDRLRILGKLKIQGTAANPINPFSQLSGGDNLIIGHNQLQMKSISRNASEEYTMITSTGSVSEIKYSATGVGYKATFNHKLCAIVVEKDGDKVHIRQLAWDGKGFYDIDKYYQGMKVTSGHELTALVIGDEHVFFSSIPTYDATFGNEDSISKLLKPSILVRHDILDCYSITHHHENNRIIRELKEERGLSNLKNELDETVNYIIDTTNSNQKSYIISSNHNDHLYKWLNTTNLRNIHGENASLYFKLNSEIKRISEEKKKDHREIYIEDPFKIYMDEYVKTNDSKVNYQFLGRRDSLLVENIELSYHGDIGPNGSRGSPNGYSKNSKKTVIGHSHSPTIEKGCWQVGTSSKLNLEYNNGPSSWGNTHVGIYPNGERVMFHILDGKWKLD